VAAEALLKLALGRLVANVAKPALYLATYPMEGVLALEEARSKAQ
jgi:hypothetical protein